MLNTFLISYRLKNAYRVNGIIYGLKQIPIIKKFLPVSLYKNNLLKAIANILSTIWEVISIFLGKIIYFAIMIILPLMFINNDNINAFLQLLLFLSIGGAIFNTGIFSPSKDKYYAVILMKMDARELVLSQYIYVLIRHYIGYFTCFIVLSYGYPFDTWLCFVLPLGIIGLKLAIVVYHLIIFDKKNIVHSETNNSPIVIIVSILFLVTAYVTVYFKLICPTKILLIIYCVAAIAALLAIVYVLKYKYYHQLAHKLLIGANTLINFDQQKIIADSYQKVITLDTNITSNKTGFEYFNELFMQRHKKIIWKAAKRQTVIAGVIVIIILTILATDSTIINDASSVLKTMLPYMVFVMYLMNTSKNVTQAMFINCDHCMLTYSFYRIPKNILKLFQIRLRELIKINLLPTLVVGIGYGMALLISGGITQLFSAVIAFVSIISMSIFFTTHYLILYYLLQPYNAYTEVKSPVYSVITSLTYIVCFYFTKVKLPILTFGILCILFCISYCIISCILVYQKAQTTFKIRN